MHKRDAKYEITLTWNLITSIIINIDFNYIKRLFFYYLRYPHDIRMKYCGCGYGCGCQNSCGYPPMRIRMRSSDTPLINILQNDIQELKSEILKKNDIINNMKREIFNISKRLVDEEKIKEISEGIVENALVEENEKGIDTVN